MATSNEVTAQAIATICSRLQDAINDLDSEHGNWAQTESGARHARLLKAVEVIMDEVVKVFDEGVEAEPLNSTLCLTCADFMLARMWRDELAGVAATSKVRTLSASS